MSGLNDIWNNEQSKGKQLPEEQLLAYMEGRLSGPELREVEEWLSNEGMESDAIEGLQQMDATEAITLKKLLDKQLQQSLKLKRRKRRGMMESKWSWLSILVILLLAVAAYAVVYLIKHH